MHKLSLKKKEMFVPAGNKLRCIQHHKRCGRNDDRKFKRVQTKFNADDRAPEEDTNL